MRNGARSFTLLAVSLAAALVCGQAAAQTAPPAAPSSETCCTRPQSPRSLTDANWDFTSTVSTVRYRNADSIFYAPRAGVEEVLHRCSQHYHCRIENVQACPKESAAPAAGETACPPTAQPGSFVEIHTAYHLKDTVIPTPEGLEKCDLETVVVVAYQAHVTAGGASSPVPPYFGPPAAEWTGSSTGVDKPPLPECKVAAFWHFALGCDFKVSQGEMARLIRPEGSRELQPPNRLSKDLTHIVRARKHAKPSKP